MADASWLPTLDEDYPGTGEIHGRIMELGAPVLSDVPSGTSGSIATT